MGFMDKVKGMLGQHGDKVQQGLDKAAQVADQKTKGKYSNQIKSGTQKAKDAAEKYSDDGKGGNGGQGKGDGGTGGGGTGGGGTGGGPRGGGSGSGS